jgi:hypothetical protein
MPKPNFGTVPDARKILSDNQITRLLDKLEPARFAENFNNYLMRTQKQGCRRSTGYLTAGFLSPWTRVVLLIGKHLSRTLFAQEQGSGNPVLLQHGSQGGGEAGRNSRTTMNSPAYLTLTGRAPDWG